jgi:hypothetical protein
MLLKNVEILVFNLTNDDFELIGEVNEFTSLIWPDNFNGYTTFELNAPITPENKFLFKKNNVIWCGGDNAAVIEIVEVDKNDSGEKKFKVKGRTLEMLLTTRIVWGTYNATNKHSSTIMYEMVDKHCVNPSQSNRKIPFLECASDEQLGKIISYQKTGGEVYDAIQSVASDSDLGFCVLFKPKEKKLIFKIIQGTDRTNVQNDNFVIFSTDLEDILSSSYYSNNQDLKTTAYVAGEDKGADRKYIVSGDNASPGFLRREVYVDAREIQSTIKDENENETTLNLDEYNDLLNDKGNEKLAECVVTESFEAKIRIAGDIQYRYGVDYFLGDKVIVQDVELGIQAIAIVSEACENFDDEYELIVTFGYSYPTIIQKIKRQFIT